MEVFSQFLDTAVDVPIVVQRHGVVEVPQLQFIDKVFTMAVETGVCGGFYAIFRARPPWT